MRIYKEANKKQGLEDFIERYRALGKASSLRERARKFEGRPTLFKQFLSHKFPDRKFDSAAGLIKFLNKQIEVYKIELGGSQR